MKQMSRPGEGAYFYTNRTPYFAGSGTIQWINFYLTAKGGRYEKSIIAVLGCSDTLSGGNSLFLSGQQPGG